tara:strand:+ start:180 stop:596 length:417 start_codon:yes stop_codon:yes gene_type:complete
MKMSKEYYYTKNKDGFMGSENRKVRKKKSETCEDKLRRMCKNVAEEITEGKTEEYIDQPKVELTADKFMEGVYSIEWITYQDHSYKAARLMVAGNGPNIWVNTQTGTVDGYWASDRCSWGFVDNIGLDEYLEELHASK